jgi:glucosamine--fructose-6-phosphate aminotransferase (isomerizing)
MCGIVGYTGNNTATDVLVSGLSKLEYRGYDSAGVAVHCEKQVEIVRREGKLINLSRELKNNPLNGTCGIGHTRWATHGAPIERNAHPHRFGKVTVVHNGIIENYAQIREELEGQGHQFSSETDTETVAHLIDQALKSNDTLLDAVKDALKHVDGSYALAIMYDDEPDTLIAASSHSPLVVGIGEDGENFIASDVPALLPFTRDFIFLEDGQFAELTPSTVNLFDKRLRSIEPEIKRISWDPVMAEKGGYKHFMLKEIFEQPRAISQTLAGRVTPRGTLQEELEELYEALPAENIKQIEIVACGTSWHAAHIGKFLFEKYARIPVMVDYASEFRYRNPVVVEGTLTIAISQSGETADTIAAAAMAKDNGSPLLSVCNVVESRLARMSEAVYYTHAGPEIGVASTKAFVTQISALILIALDLGGRREQVSRNETVLTHRGLAKVPMQIEAILELDKKIKKIARKLHKFDDFLYLGRGVHYPLALEGALKLKEISYIHAEGYPAGEMKHGPIALIDENLPAVCVMTQSKNQDKLLSNVEEVRARNGIIVGIVSEGDDAAKDLCDYAIEIPSLSEELDVLLASVPLQLLAYHIAILRGTDVDQPRNLAKSVTVE